MDATIELTCSMLEPDDDEEAYEEACAVWDETDEMYQRAAQLVKTVGANLRISEHEERGIEYRDAYADVDFDDLEHLLDLFDEHDVGYDNIDLHEQPDRRLLARLRRRYPRGSGVDVNILPY